MKRLIPVTKHQLHVNSYSYQLHLRNYIQEPTYILYRHENHGSQLMLGGLAFANSPNLTAGTS